MAKRGPYNDLKTDVIKRFWQHGLAQPVGARWHIVPEADCCISLTTGIDFVRVFVRTTEGGKPAKLRSAWNAGRRSLSRFWERLAVQARATSSSPTGSTST